MPAQQAQTIIDLNVVLEAITGQRTVSKNKNNVVASGITSAEGSAGRPHVWHRVFGGPVALQIGPLYTQPNPDLADFSVDLNPPGRAHRQRVPKPETAVKDRAARLGVADRRFLNGAEAPESAPVAAESQGLPAEASGIIRVMQCMIDAAEK